MKATPMPRSHCGRIDVAQRAPGSGAEIARRLERDVADRAHAAVDRQHGEGQQEIGERHDDAVGAVDQRVERLVDQPEVEQRELRMPSRPRMLFQA